MAAVHRAYMLITNMTMRRPQRELISLPIIRPKVERISKGCKGRITGMRNGQGQQLLTDHEADVRQTVEKG